MPALKKTLVALVHDRTFLARRHSALLVDDELVGDPELRALQVQYRVAYSEPERTALARAFEGVVQRLDDDELSLQQELLGSIGPHPQDSVTVGALSWEEFNELERRWERWDKRDGLNWRARAGFLTNADVANAYRRLTDSRARRRLDWIFTAIPYVDLVQRVRDTVKRRPPNPPGWEYVS